MNVLILSSTASAINYKLSLKDFSGLKLFITDSNPKSIGLYDDYITPLVIPRARDTENYRIELDRIIALHNIEILLPTSDNDMQGVGKLLKNGWKPNVKMFQFDPEVLDLMVDKSRVIDYLNDIGNNNVPLNYKDYLAMDFPAVVKPTLEGGSKGVKIAENRKEFDQFLQETKSNYGNDFVVQQFIPGGVGSIHVVLLLYGNDGELYGENVTKSSLTFYSWGGGGNAGYAVDEPELIEIAVNIVKKLGGWKGPINLEFKKSSLDNQFYLMEVNCRLNGYSYLNTMLGLNFPKAIIELLDQQKTDKLNFSKITRDSNFILNYREKPIEKWLD